MKVIFNRLLLYISCLAMMAIVSACGSASKPMTVVIFSASDPSQATALPDTSENMFQPDLSQMPTPQGAISKGTPQPDISLAIEQNRGYTYAENEVTPTGQAQYTAPIMKYQLENNPQEEIAALVREEVVDKERNVVAVLGATSNEKSLRLASFSNAFNVPMIIPSSVGDNLLPPDNLWVFRLSAPGSAYAQYFFSNVLTRSTVDAFDDEFMPSELPSSTPTLTPSPTPFPSATPTGSTSATPISPTESLPLSPTPLPFKIAILYEQNTFGESSAVAAAREAMKQGVSIGFYGSFDPSNLDITTLERQINEEIRGVHLVYLIGSQPGVAKIIVQSIRTMLSEQTPILLGQSGAFSSREFLDSPQARGMFVLQQKISADCVDEDISLTEAQSYAAVVLLRSAIESAKDKVGNLYASQTLLQKREGIRDQLQIFNQDLKCLGRVSFDHMGQNQNLQFEILQINCDSSEVSSEVIEEKTFQEKLKSIYNSNVINDSSPFDIGPESNEICR